MSLSDLCDHVIDVYGPTEVKGSMGQVDETWAKTTSVNAAVWPQRQGLKNEGAGETSGGDAWRVAIDDPQASVRTRDVLEVVQGPNAPLRLRVVSVACPRGHHLEITAEVWDGEIA